MPRITKSDQMEVSMGLEEFLTAAGVTDPVGWRCPSGQDHVTVDVVRAAPVSLPVPE